MDCGFLNRRRFLAPYRGLQYHLQDFAGHGNDPENEKGDREYLVFLNRVSKILSQNLHFCLRQKQNLC